jgi:hypothetical protein
MTSLAHSEILSMMQQVGSILSDDQSSAPSIEIDAECQDNGPAVYAWVFQGTILYIGKAGRGLRHRMRQHASGFRNSARGKSHAQFLAPLIASGNGVQIWAWWPQPTTVRGYAVPMHSAIEDWLIVSADPTPVRNRVAGRVADTD